MYNYAPPKPIPISLAGEEGYRFRVKAVDFVNRFTARGAEAGSPQEQSYGILAELVIRNQLDLPDLDPDNHPIGYDIEISSSIKIDIKCRGGIKPFQETYAGGDGIPREAKHNFFARQVYDSTLNTDIYVMTHLTHPNNTPLPGTVRQRSWILFVCGWVSKGRVIKEGVYLPRGALTEQGNSWFPYRSHEIEFYHQHLNGLLNLKDLLNLDRQDVENDISRSGNLHLTSVDAIRIANDLVGKGIVSIETVKFLQERAKITGTIKSIFHQNQYFHLLRWLKSVGKISESEIQKLKEIMSEENYSQG